MERVGMGYRHIYSSNASYVDYDAMEEDIFTIRDFDYLLRFDKYHYSRNQITIKKFTVDTVNCQINYSFKLDNSMWFVAGSDSSELKMDRLIDKLMSNYGMESTNKIPAREMRLHDSKIGRASCRERV